MGFQKEEKLKKVLRGIKTLFFLIAMLFSFLLFCAPVVIAIADILLPFSLLSASLNSFSFQMLFSLLKNYEFRQSLVDIPLLSLLRSAVILCVYGFCDGPRLSRGPYLGLTTICSVSSLIYVALKAPYVLVSSDATVIDRGGGGGDVRGLEIGLVICSLVLAIGHIVVAHRTSCRERRKLLIYKIDLEAVSACKKGFPMYQKLLQEERLK